MNDDLSDVVDWIDRHENEMIEFVADFVSYRSATGDELAVQRDHIVPSLEEMGFDEVEVVDVSDDGIRPNVNATLRGSGDGRNLLFNGHCDVVDVSDRKQAEFWTSDPWDPFVEDGRMYGRGTSDMKGPLSSVIWALRSVIETKPDLAGDVLLSIVVGEEQAQQDIGAIPATEALLEEVSIPFCVNCEPTNLEIHTESAALFNIDIRLQGKAVHASQHNLVRYPQRKGLSDGRDVGVDALRSMGSLLDRLHELEHQLNMQPTDTLLGSGGYPEPVDHQGVGTITIIPTMIDAGEYVASIADEARVQGQVYLPPAIEPAAVRAKIEAVVDGMMATDDWLAEHPPEIEFGGQLGDHREYDHWPAFNVPMDDPGPQALGRAVEAVTGEEPIYSGFKAVTDGGFIQNVCGIDTISYGPGNTTMGVHGANEYVPLSQLSTAAKVYAAMILEWCQN